MLWTPADASRFLLEQGESSAKAREALTGFNFQETVYVQHPEEGEEVFQYRRKPGYPGNWIALEGASVDQLAIFSGNEG